MDRLKSRLHIYAHSELFNFYQNGAFDRYVTLTNPYEPKIIS